MHGVYMMLPGSISGKGSIIICRPYLQVHIVYWNILQKIQKRKNCLTQACCFGVIQTIISTKHRWGMYPLPILTEHFIQREDGPIRIYWDMLKVMMKSG